LATVDDAYQAIEGNTGGKIVIDLRESKLRGRNRLSRPT
jgi:hypothetical protein